MIGSALLPSILIFIFPPGSNQPSACESGPVSAIRKYVCSAALPSVFKVRTMARVPSIFFGFEVICDGQVLILVAKGRETLCIESVTAKLVVGMPDVEFDFFLRVGRVTFVFDGRL